MKYKSHLVGVQEVSREGSATKPVGEYTFFCGKRKQKHELDTGSFSVRKTIISAVTRVEFVSQRCHT
jgi:hypothetical protein